MTTQTISYQDAMASHLETLTTRGHTEAEKESARRGIDEIARAVDILTEPIAKARREEAKRRGKMDLTPSWAFFAHHNVECLLRRGKKAEARKEEAADWLRELAFYADDLTANGIG